MTEGNEYSVFISHSSKDRWIARQMTRLIEERCGEYGVTTFLDEKDIEGGDVFAERIFDAIRRCDELVVLVSPSSVTRPWVLAEVGAALGQKKRVVGIVDNVPLDDIPDLLSQRKAIHLNNFDEYLRELGRRAEEAKSND